jgi:hypothetical protein
MLLALKKLVIVVVAAIAGFFKRLFGREKTKPAPQQSPSGVRAPSGAYSNPAQRPTTTSNPDGRQ